ncbi:MAG TPA: tetratricopeptide repeat protein [Saprospiraceae bacterium]|nr:tetratricopeptide repeat protein [Saprospiraceae bacterium]
MATRKSKKSDETLVDIVQVKVKAEDFFERNQIAVLATLGAIVLIIGGLFVYQNVYKKPRNEKAMAQMFQAQFQFERDSFALALDNPGGGYDGFLDIIDKFSGTKASNLANYYAGVCYLHLGRYEAAIDFLNDFKAAGEVTPIMKHGTLGDAYSELEDWKNAISHYEKAAETSNNEYLTPYYLKKLGLLYERQGDQAKALKAFERIKKDYPNTTASQGIDKYIARAKVE